MALAILDGTQTATTLSTILSSGQHITAHTVVSLGTQAITDILNATSAGITNTQLRASAVTIGGTVTVGNSVTISSLPAISGVVTANIPEFINEAGVGKGIGIFSYNEAGENFFALRSSNVDTGALKVEPISLPAISGTVAISTMLPAGTNRIGVVTIGAGTVTIGAGTAQIGSVTASISGTVPISISSVTVGNSVTIGSLPAISGTVTAVLSGTSYVEIAGGIQNYVFDYTSFPVSGSVTANTFAVQGTAVTTSNFTSTTASTVLASYNATRQVLTIFNEGAGNLHIAPGATCTTIAYQVRLSAGDYYEVPNHQTTITHSAVFATAGTARICQLS